MPLGSRSGVWGQHGRSASLSEVEAGPETWPCSSRYRRVLPDVHPLEGALDDYIVDEHTIGRLLDLGVIAPRLTETVPLVDRRVGIPEVADIICDATPAYPWEIRATRTLGHHGPTRLIRAVRRTLRPSPR